MDKGNLKTAGKAAYCVGHQSCTTTPLISDIVTESIQSSDLITWCIVYTVSQINNTEIAHFNAHQPILVIFGTDIAEW